MDCGRLGSTIACADLDENILRIVLGILDEDVEVAVRVEDAGVQQFIFVFGSRAPPVRLNQVVIGEGRLGILVQVFHVRVGRRVIEVKVVLLDILTVIAFAVVEAEQSFLQDRVAAVPQRQGETEQLLVVADARESILTPAIRSGPCLVVGQVLPGIAVLAVVLPDRTPLPLAQIGPPLFPGNSSYPALLKPMCFRVSLKRLPPPRVSG